MGINIPGSGMPHSNPNLLHNWYFADPINQRQQVSYTGSGRHCIDRWYRGYDNNAVLTLHDGYISLSGSSAAEFMQRLEHLYLGHTVTISALLHGGVLAFATGTLPSSYDGGYFVTGINVGLPGTNGAGFELSYYSGRLRFNFVIPAGSEVNLVAVKLEIGAVSTLAYDAPPDRGAELARCQRYYEVITSESLKTAGYHPKILYAVDNRCCLVLQPWKVTKRVLPTVTVNGAREGEKVKFRCSSDDIFAEGTLVSWNESYLGSYMTVEIGDIVTAFTPGKIYEATIIGDAEIY